MKKLKTLFVRTIFYRPLLDARRTIEERKIRAYNGQSRETRNYCISPYKTGTTYISNLFSAENRCAHEPFHYTSLHHLDESSFLLKRSRYLNLDLESSGFFAARLQKLRQISPNSPVLFLSRPPEEWIGSVLNYFSHLKEVVRYNYVARLYFDPICGGAVDAFFEEGRERQTSIVKGLLEYYVSVYEAALADTYSRVIPLREAEGRIGEIEDFFGLRASRNGNIWKRTNMKKRDIRLGQYVDMGKYAAVLEKMGYGPND